MPFEKELVTLPFQKKKFPGIFREGKIVLPGQIDLPSDFRPRVDSKTSLNAASGVFTPRTTTPSSVYSPLASIPNLDGAAMGLKNLHLREHSTDSTVNSSESGGGTWATVTKKGANRPFKDLVRTTSEPTPESVIKRNRKGQRIDEPMEYDRDQVQRFKKLKSCNQHYIGIGCCHFNAGKADKCPHAHHHTFNNLELKWLRVVARETPCKKGHECDDLKCIYGHQCPFPPATEGSMRGIGCLNGDTCRFSRSMHNMDTQPVKMIKATGMF